MRALGLLVLLAGCREGVEKKPLPPPEASSRPASLIHDVTEKAGLTFEHFTGATGEKFLPETLGSGVCVLDFDEDGWPDLYFVNGAPLPPSAQNPTPTNRLYRNRGDGTFEDISESSGSNDTGYGIGCSVGDFDSDGHVDLYVSNFGPNTLYRNLGQGSFTNVTESSGTGDSRFSTGGTFFDFDNDGDLDLYVVNYMEIDLENNKYCGEIKEGYRAYCGPESYPGSADRLYKNEGQGRFVDVSEEAGIADPEGKGLGVVAFDFDEDRDLDLYVANDGMLNYLYENLGQGRFREIGLQAGVALDDQGAPQAGMGVDFGDYDGDGRMDLFVANLSFQPSALYRNNGNGTFSERSFLAGLATVTQLQTGYGAGFWDYDNDGDVDLYEMNGNMLDNVALYFDNVTYPEPGQIFRNQGDGTFLEVTADAAPALAVPRVGRGSAFLDYDGNGTLDLVQLVAAGRARLFQNLAGVGHHWLGVKLVGTRSNPQGFGAVVELETEKRSQRVHAKASSGYASQSETTVHFGLGQSVVIKSLEVHWPSGLADRVPPPAIDQVVIIREGSGVVEILRRGQQPSSGDTSY